MSVTHAFAGAFRVMPIDVEERPVRQPKKRRGLDGELKPLNVDLEQLEIGARDASDVTQSYLDLETGEVLVVVRGEPDARLLKQRVRSERRRYRRIPAFGLQEERTLLRAFLAEETNGPGGALLLRLVDEPGAFHACLTALKADHALWVSWERFENRGVRSSLLAWMAGLGVRPQMITSALTDD